MKHYVLGDHRILSIYIQYPISSNLKTNQNTNFRIFTMHLFPKIFSCIQTNTYFNKPSWWFQPIWKIWLSNWESSPNRGEHKKYLKPPPRNPTNQLLPVLNVGWHHWSWCSLSSPWCEFPWSCWGHLNSYQKPSKLEVFVENRSIVSKWPQAKVSGRSCWKTVLKSTWYINFHRNIKKQK